MVQTEELFQSKVCLESHFNPAPVTRAAAGQGHTGSPSTASPLTPQGHTGTSIPTLGRNTRQEAHLKHCPAFIYTFKRNPKLAQGLSLNSSSNCPGKAVYSLGTLKSCLFLEPIRILMCKAHTIMGLQCLTFLRYIFRNSKLYINK